MCIFLGKRFFSPQEAPSCLKEVNPYWAHTAESPDKPLQMGTSGSPGSLCSTFLAMLSAHLTQNGRDWRKKEGKDREEDRVQRERKVEVKE